MGGTSAPAVNLTPEGPGGVTSSAGGIGLGATGVGGSGTDPQSMLAQSQQSEMAMIELQAAFSEQQNGIMLLSNMEKSKTDTEKSVIQDVK
jgi:hypothetical protein